MIPTKGFGLRSVKTKELVSVSTRSNAGGDCCCETQYLLDLSGDAPWIVEDAINAEWVRLNSTEWYNAGYETPTNEYDPEELEVVAIELVVKKAKVLTLPTFAEYITRRYNTPGLRSYDTGHAKYVLSEPRFCKYSLYDLRDLLRQEEDAFKKEHSNTNPKNWGLHENHCCPKHGCKYGDSDCPVVTGLTKKYNKSCEDCEREEEQPKEDYFLRQELKQIHGCATGEIMYEKIMKDRMKKKQIKKDGV